MAKAKTQTKTKKSASASELSRAWEYHKNADQVLGARMSYGMIAQSMFLLSYVTLYLVAAEPIWLPAAVQLGIASLWPLVHVETKRDGRGGDREDAVLARGISLQGSHLCRSPSDDHSRCGATTSRLIPGFFVLWGALAVLASVLIVLEVLGHAKTGT